MSNLMRFVKSVAAVLFAVLIAACGSSNNSAAPVHLRFVNATPASTLSVTLNGTGQFSGVTAATATGYAQLTPANYTIQVASSTGALATSTQLVGLASGQTYTLLAYQREGAIVAELVVEDQTLPASGYASIAVSNSSPDPGTLDVYIVPPGTTSLTGLSPTFQQVVFGATPSATTMVVGTYDIVATATGNPSDVRSRLSSVAIGSTQILLAAFTSTSGGALVDAVLLTQGGSVQFAPTTQARVRVVSALPSSPPTPVTATVGSTTLASVYSPIAGAYTLVPGGTSSTSYSIAAGGAAPLTGSATFAAGGDFTILVYNAASPTVSILTDNNQSPIGSNTNLRLVNAGVSNGAPGMTLQDNGVQVATGVQYGQASGYFGVTAAATSSLTVIAPGNSPGPTSLTTSTVSLNVAGGVYTIFVVDGTLIPYPSRDR
jgi:hypothetical protein